MQTDHVKLPALPSSWPNDGRARVRMDAGGNIHAIHPQRETVQLIAGKWLTTTEKQTEKNHANR